MINPFKRRKEKTKRREQEIKLKEEALALERKKMRMYERILMQQQQEKQRPEYKAPWLPAGVVPKGKTAPVAQDSCISMYQYAGEQDANFFPAFVGYPQLAMLSQSSDYRSVPETTATEMTREWGRFEVVGAIENDEDANEERQEKIKALEMEFKRYNIRSLIQRAIEVEMTMGRAQIYIDLGSSDDSLPFVLSPRGVQKGSLKGFALIEPMWSTPSAYNASDPTAKDFYVPQKWYVMGKETHADRLVTLVMRPVPDMLKPAYNFGGISMLQLMMPYVQRYQRTADSVAELVRAFSLSILSTDMAAVLAGENDPNILMRAMLFNQHRDNTGLMLLDKESEEISQINTPLSGLPELLAKAQEQMAGPSHTPLVKLLGITPSGLNANSDGEIRVYYDYISAQNEAHIRPVIERVSQLIQLNLFGEIDQSIRWEFEPLKQMDGKELAEISEIKARTSVTLVDGGIISQEEARQTLADDPASDYSSIVVEDVPEMPEQDFDMGGLGTATDSDIHLHINEAVKAVNTAPTDTQKESGNYAKGHVRIHGLDIAIENPRGEIRSGTDKNGEEWNSRMSAHYGYIKRSMGADGDQVDVYIGPSPDSQCVFIINQVDQVSGVFDEHKVMIGYRSKAEALSSYESCFSPGWKVGDVFETDIEGLKKWLSGDTSGPFNSTLGEE